MQQLIKNTHRITKQEVRGVHMPELLLKTYMDTTVEGVLEKALEHVMKYGYLSNGIEIKIEVNFK